MNNTHLYSTVMKPQQLHKSSSNSTNYTTLLSTTAPATTTTTTTTKMINSSNSHPSISGPSQQQPQYTTAATYSSRSKDQFVNPYVRTSNNLPAGLPANHYSNVEPTERLLSAGVYNAHQHNRYKTNSLGGGSSSSGVVSTGGSSPGHSPVGSMSGQNGGGTHV